MQLNVAPYQTMKLDRENTEIRTRKLVKIREKKTDVCTYSTYGPKTKRTVYYEQTAPQQTKKAHLIYLINDSGE